MPDNALILTTILLVCHRSLVALLLLSLLSVFLASIEIRTRHFRLFGDI